MGSNSFLASRNRKSVEIFIASYLLKNLGRISRTFEKCIRKPRKFRLLVKCFHKALDYKKVHLFREALKTWYIIVRNSKLKPFLKLAKTIRKYRKNIEAYIESRLTTAAEGLNNKIKVLKRMAYGYSNPVSFCRKILQRCGYLNHLSINTDEFFFRWPQPRLNPEPPCFN
jgi:transposase